MVVTEVPAKKARTGLPEGGSRRRLSLTLTVWLLFEVHSTGKRESTGLKCKTDRAYFWSPKAVTEGRAATVAGAGNLRRVTCVLVILLVPW